MRNNDILIRQIIFDLDIASQADFQAYTISISQIVKERIGPMLEDIALKHYGNRDIVVKNLTVNLDEIDLENWEAYEGTVYDQLFNQLRLTEIPSNNYDPLDTRSLTLSELLSFIAEFGLLPWSYNTKQKVNSFFKDQIEQFKNKNSLFNILISNQTAYRRIFNVLDPKSSQLFLKFLLKRDYPHYKRLQDFNKSLVKIRGLSPTLGSIKKEEYQILKYFYENANNIDRSIQQSVDHLKKTYSLNSNELNKLNRIEKKVNASSESLNEQLQLTGSAFKAQHFKQLIQLLIKLENNNSLKKTLGSNDFNDPSSVSKFFVKGDFFKTLRKIVQLYKKNQNLSEQKLVKKLLDFLIQNKASNKFEQSVVLTLGDAIFGERKFESLRSTISFKNLLSALKIKSVDRSIEQSVDHLKKTYSLNSNELSKLNRIEKKVNASSESLNEQLQLTGSAFKAQHFKQLIQLLIKLENNNSLKKTLGSNDFNDPSSVSKFFVKGDFFKTLRKIVQLYKKNQNLSEQKLVKKLLDFLIQNKASNKFEQSVVLRLGDAIFGERKFESLRSATSFKNLLSALKIKSVESFVEVVDIIDTILTLETRNIKKHKIQARALKALYPSLEKTKINELFVAVLKSFDVDRKLPTFFQVDSLDEQKISKIFEQVRKMQTLPNRPTSLDSNYFEFILNIRG